MGMNLIPIKPLITGFKTQKPPMFQAQRVSDLPKIRAGSLILYSSENLLDWILSQSKFRTQFCVVSYKPKAAISVELVLKRKLDSCMTSKNSCTFSAFYNMEKMEYVSNNCVSFLFFF